jgi:hypothetical protein
MPRLDFFKRRYDESTVLERARKRASDQHLQGTLDILYFHPGASDEEIARELKLDEQSVRLRLRPQAQRLIDQERARNSGAIVGPVQGAVVAADPDTGPLETTVTELAPGSIDEMEAQAIQVVMKANVGVSLDNHLRKAVLFLFKTFAPFAVLSLTIPESIYVFSHIYRHPDQLLSVLTGVFALLVDFGYLYLTVLLAMNKEAIFKRLRAGLEVEPHERRAVSKQTILWWLVAVMDTLAQVVFLYGATKDSAFFPVWLVMTLVGVRILSLFITMFVVSFAGTELMTSVDKTTNEQVERAYAVSKVLSATGKARLQRMEARIKLEQLVADQELRREGEKFLTDLYADAREEARQLREATRRLRLQGPGDSRKLN